jgi:hypothetical protein
VRTWPAARRDVFMTARLRAIRALRLNYTRRGVWVWLRGRKRRSGLRGWQEVLREPERVTREQHAIAEGVIL